MYLFTYFMYEHSICIYAFMPEEAIRSLQDDYEPPYGRWTRTQDLWKSSQGSNLLNHLSSP